LFGKGFSYLFLRETVALQYSITAYFLILVVTREGLAPSVALLLVEFFRVEESCALRDDELNAVMLFFFVSIL